MRNISNAATGGIVVTEGNKSVKISGVVIIDAATGLPRSNQLTPIAAIITTGTAISSGVDLGAGRVVRLDVPAAWTTANITFQASTDGVTYFNLHDKAGAEYIVTAAPSRSIIIPLADLEGVRYIKVRSGTAAAPVNQLTSDKTITLVLKA